MNESLEFLKEYCDFSEPNWLWILTGISRNKDNTDNETFFIRKVIKDESDIEFCYNEIKQKAVQSNVNCRIYISLNARDAMKCFFNYKIKLEVMTKEMFHGASNDLVKKLDSVWKKELASSSNKGTKRMLLDIDNFQDIDTIYMLLDEDKNVKVIHTVKETKTGCVAVIDACDTRDLVKKFKEEKIELDIQNDSLVFVEYIENN